MTLTGVRTRTLTADEHKAFVLARLGAVARAPYFAHALFAVQPVAAEGLGTFAVDPRWRLYMDPAVLLTWSVPNVSAVLVHEVGHLLRDHAGRARTLPQPVNHATWNYATDAAINDDLLKVGYDLPEGAVTPEALELPVNGVEETYYSLLHDRWADHLPPADEQGCGSGAGDPQAEWELDATGRAPMGQDAIAPGLSPGRADEVRRQVAHAVTEQVRSQGRGATPAGVQRWAEDALTPPQVPWQSVLGAALRRAVTHTRGNVEPTYTRMSRRRVPGVILPGRRSPVVNIAVVLDTSASVSPGQLSTGLSEIDGVLATGATGPRHAAHLHVVTCDADVASCTRVQRAADVALAGGGGTDMRVGIDAAAALRPRPDVIIVMSDGYTLWPDIPTRARLIVVLYGGADAPADMVPSWATTIPVG